MKSILSSFILSKAVVRSFVNSEVPAMRADMTFSLKLLYRPVALMLAFSLSFFGAAPMMSSAWANPDYSHTEYGQIRIEEEGSVYTIYAGNQAIGAFNSFGNEAGETINFIQAAAYYTALYRVIGTDPSIFYGVLNANSRIFLINPSGILFGPSSEVNAPGLVASTLALSNENFLAKNYLFEQDPDKAAGYILNQGKLVATNGGYIALLAGAVRNEGTIEAEGGTVALAAGKEITLSLDGDGLVAVQVDSPLEYEMYDFDGNRIMDAIAHLGTISADEGGYVVLTAKATEQLFDNAINVQGMISATSVVDRGGVIELLASDPVENTGELGWQNNLGKVENAQGNVVVTGTLDVSAAEDGAQAGKVTLAGERVGLAGVINAQGATDADGGQVLLTSTKQTLVTETGEINTSGGANSSAGNVVIWSDKLTRFAGTILGRGGALGGDGANVEISGHESLYARGMIDLLAPLGKIGTVLYDPLNIQITGGNADGSDNAENNADELKNKGGGSNAKGTITFADEGSGSPDPFLIYESEIEGSNANIDLQARNSITTSGTFDNDGGEGNGVVLVQNDRSLTMQTRNNAGDGAGAIDLTGSDHGNDLEFKTQGTGGITVTGSTDGTSAANVTVSKLTTTGTGSIAVTTNNGTVTVNGALTTGDTTSDSGGITVSGTGDVALNAAVTTGDDTVSSTAGADVAQTGNISVTSTGGSITGNGSAVLTTGNATVDAAGGGADTATSGTITLSASGGVTLPAANTLTVGSATVNNAVGARLVP